MILSQTESDGGKSRPEENMEKMFCLGLMLGALGGALLVANSYKMRSIVKKSQAEFVGKVNEMMDERLGCEKEKSEDEKGTEKKRK